MSRQEANRWRRRARRPGRLRAILEDALASADPIRLIAMGAPDDEYDPEVETILPRLRSAGSAAEVRTVLHEEFVRWFDERTAGPPERYTAAAAAIWAQIGRAERSAGPRRGT